MALYPLTAFRGNESCGQYGLSSDSSRWQPSIDPRQSADAQEAYQLLHYYEAEQRIDSEKKRT
jgi:hypothetical protein